MRAGDLFLIPFSLLWGGFAIFWEVSVIAAGAPLGFMLWGIPFVLFGLYMIIGRFWVEARKRARTVYGVTSERIIVLSSFMTRGIKSINIDTIADLSLTERIGGGGAIYFGTVPMVQHFGDGAGWPAVAAILASGYPTDCIWRVLRTARRRRTSRM